MLRIRQDSANITELDASDSDHRIFGIITSLQQDISLTLTRFSSHLEAHEGFLMYVLNGTKENWRPTVAEQELGDLIKSVKFLRTRLDTLSKRAVNILNFVSKFDSIFGGALARLNMFCR